MFTNRLEAGKLLAKELSPYKNNQQAIIVAIPNGGIMTAYSVSKILELPLEIELVKKIRHPNDYNKIIGAVSIHGNEFDKDSGVTFTFFENDAATYEELLLSKHDLFLGNRAIHSLEDKIVILVDDGIETGNTISLAIRLIKTKKPKKIIVAVPLAPKKALDQLKAEVQEVICLGNLAENETLKDHYKQFNPVKDSTVIRLLREESSK